MVYTFTDAYGKSIRILMMLRPARAGGEAHGEPAAFTLVEILVVIVVLSIICLLIIPGSGDREAARLRSAAELLISDLGYARLNSIGNGADPCVVVFDDAASRYHLARQSDPQMPLRDPGTGLPYITDFGGSRALMLEGVRVDGLEIGGDDRLAFTPFGAIDQGTDAKIALRCGAHTINVVVDAGTGESGVSEEESPI